MLPELIRLMKPKAAAGSDIPAAAERFAARINEKPLTLMFSEDDMSLARSLFGWGKMAPPSLFDDITKEYLFLPQSQNEVLTKSVQLEKMYFISRKKRISPTFSICGADGQGCQTPQNQ